MEEDLPGGALESATLYDELEACEERLAESRRSLLRARHYFAWKIPVLVGVWYLTTLIELPRWAMFAFVLAVAFDYFRAEARVRAAERDREEIAALIAQRGLVEW